MVFIPEMSNFCGSSKYAFLAISIFLIVLAVFLYVASTGRKDGTQLRYGAMASLCLGAIFLTIFSFCL